MYRDHARVSLGFAGEKVHAGAHICQIYSDYEECVESLLRFTLSGLQAGERITCFSEKIDEGKLGIFLSGENIAYADFRKKNRVVLAGTGEVYLQDGRFDPDRMLDRLSAYYRESVEMGFPAARVIGEMIPEVQSVPGGDRLLEYESRVSMLLRDHPVTAVCQYDANEFDGATIMDVLKVHPQMIIGGSIIHNPFYIKPEEFLRRF